MNIRLIQSINKTKTINLLFKENNSHSKKYEQSKIKKFKPKLNNVNLKTNKKRKNKKQIETISMIQNKLIL